jgi:hypothetical protein
LVPFRMLLFSAARLRRYGRTSGTAPAVQKGVRSVRDLGGHACPKLPVYKQQGALSMYCRVLAAKQAVHAVASQDSDKTAGNLTGGLGQERTIWDILEDLCSTRYASKQGSIVQVLRSGASEPPFPVKDLQVL